MFYEEIPDNLNADEAANQKCNSHTVLFELTEAKTIIKLIIMQENDETTQNLFNLQQIFTGTSLSPAYKFHVNIEKPSGGDHPQWRTFSSSHLHLNSCSDLGRIREYIFSSSFFFIQS